MSKIGKQPIQLPDDVEIFKRDQILYLMSPLVRMSIPIPPCLDIFIEYDVHVRGKNEQKKTKTIWGTYRNTLQNTIQGISQGFQVTLKLVGVGYRATLDEKRENLILKVGFSHLIDVPIPKYVNINIIKNNKLIMRSYNLNLLMQFAAIVRQYKKPEPYKGKGILYKGEKIKRKEGKKK